jgi:hypothetical protein
MVRHDSSLQRMRFHCSRVQWWQALYHFSQHMVLGMVIQGLCAAARQWKPISWSSQWVLVRTLRPEAVWNSVLQGPNCYTLHVLALGGPVPWPTTNAEPLLLLDVSTSQHLQLTGATLAGQKLDELTCWKGGTLWRCHIEWHWALHWALQ